MLATVRRLESSLFHRVMALPTPLTRLLAGRPTVRDGQTLDLQAQLMLRLARLLREQGAESLPLARSREAMLRHSGMVGGDQPIGSVREVSVAGAEGPLPARLYLPRGANRPGPLLVFFHGGGMSSGCLDSHDGVCRYLAETAGVRVLAVDYRLAPEHPFPAGHDDACAAYSFVARHPEEFGADPRRLAVGGDSAGGYLAAAAAIHAAREGLPLAYQLLVYPVTDFAEHAPSHALFDEGFYLTRKAMDLYTERYLAGHDPYDPRASLRYADLPAGLAPAHVVTAGFDPLRDEGEGYARRMEEAGVAVTTARYPGLIHGFLNMVGVEGAAKQAVTEIAGVLAAAMVAGRTPDQPAVGVAEA